LKLAAALGGRRDRWPRGRRGARFNRRSSRITRIAKLEECFGIPAGRLALP